MNNNIQDVEKPSYGVDISNMQILSKPIDPVKYLKIVEDKEFEEIIHEWAYGYLKQKYEKVCILGGSGDKGRDIAAYYDYKNNIWDNYQCKHYNHKLNPSDIIVEIAKLCYFCYAGQLTIPKNFYFVSPLGVGPKLHDLLKKPTLIKDNLKKTWEKSCKNKIIANQNIELDSNFENYIDNFDFSIFDYVDPKELIMKYKETCYFLARFGGVSKPRPLPTPPPNSIQAIESVYIRKILEAYSDFLGKSIENTKKLDGFPKLKKDFDRHRTCFFCAESLKEFSRDIYDPDFKHFDNLKQEIYDGIINTIEDDADNGFARLKKVLERADVLAITNNPLMSSVKINDRRGICHHLANDREDVKWKK